MMDPLSSLLALVLSAPARPAPAPEAPAAAPPSSPTTDAEVEAAPPAAEAPSGEVTYYQFSGLGIDGELRTPALLQFLSRIGGEFETVGIPHRSFMPELAQTVMEDAL
jgi:hypothetical protein